MGDPGITIRIEGGNFQGITGAGYVYIENYYAAPTGLPSKPSKKQSTDINSPCPYPGLANFRPEDSELFFGRNRAVSRLEAGLNHRSLTAVIGASGSGKSSLVLAGLAPCLASRGEWRFSHFRISQEQIRDPFFALARALSPLLGANQPIDRIEATQRLAVGLESGSISLANVLGECRRQNSGKRILLIADQFEELFTSSVDDGRQRRFIHILTSCFPPEQNEGPPQLCLVITLRADFYGVALLNRELADTLQKGLENLGPMDRNELSEAILKPAGAVVYEEGLVNKLLDDVEESPGSLPLMQFALREMWERQKGGLITRASYEAIGGVCGALAQRAQAIFDEFTASGSDGDQVLSFRRLFTRMVNFNEGAFDSRRVVDRSELDVDDWHLAQRLASEHNRLVVTNANEPGLETVEFVHETMIRSWPMLAEWVREDRRFQSWLRHLKAHLDVWKSAPEDHTRLLSGYSLATAERWFQDRKTDLNPDERTFIQNSIDWRRSEIRKRSRTRKLVLVAAVIAFLAIAVAWWRAIQSFHEASQGYETAVMVLTSVTKEVKAHLLPNGEELPKSQLAENLLRESLSRSNELRPEHETPSGALLRLELFEDLWNIFYFVNDVRRASDAADRELEIAQRENLSDRDRFRHLDWLAYMARAYENQGANARSTGDLRLADARYESAEKIANRLQAARLELARATSVDSAKIPWKNELPHAQEYRGDIFRDEEKFAEAQKQYEGFLTFVNSEDSHGDVVWQREITVVHGKLGDMLLQRGDLNRAQGEFELDLRLSRDLVKQALSRRDFERGVAVSYERLAFVLRKRGQLEDALRNYEEDLNTAEKLVSADSANTQFQRDLALAYEGLGDVSRDRHKIADAQGYFYQYHKIMEGVFARSPSARFKRDLAIADERLGGSLLAEGNGRGADIWFHRCASDAVGASTAFDPRNPDPKNVRTFCEQRLTSRFGDLAR